jgi:hypothetical protein
VKACDTKRLPSNVLAINAAPPAKECCTNVRRSSVLAHIRLTGRLVFLLMRISCSLRVGSIKKQATVPSVPLSSAAHLFGHRNKNDQH